MSPRIAGLVRGTFALLLFLAGVFSTTSEAQTLPAPTADDELGMLPYQSYHGGDIDTVNLSTGSLSLDLPFLVYPQRGKLHLAFNLFFNDQGQYLTKFCPPVGSCLFIWGYTPIPSPLPLERSDPYVGIAEQFEVLGTTVSLKYTDFTKYWSNWNLQTADGSKHPLGNQGTMTTIVNGTWYMEQYSGPFETLDASGWRVNGTFTASNATWSNQPPTSIIDADGVTYDTSTTYEEDPNGNEITVSGTTITDSLGRQIPLPPTSKTSSNTTTAGCPVPPQVALPVSFAVLWNVPGPNLATVQYKFCYATVTMNIPPNLGLTPNQGSSATPTKLQSIVLPNSQTWNFTYNDPGDGSTYNGLPINFGSLSQITLPTGGTISYSYTTGGACLIAGRWVAQRTVNANDGAGPHIWTYAYTSGTTPTTTVTDPMGNYVVHTFGLSTCAGYETQTQYYQSDGTPLKTVTTVFGSTGNRNAGAGGLINVVPTHITPEWANGQESQVVKNYDAGFTFTDYLGGTGIVGIYGKILTETASDYGSGAPGSILRTTTNTYQALGNSTYLTNNLLNLPASVKVTGGSQTAYTTYRYDETALASSSISIQHDSSPPDGSSRGNQTSVHRQLNNGSAAATLYCPAVSSGGYLVSNITYYDTGMASVSKDACSLPTTYLYSSTYVGAFPTTVTNAKNQSMNYTFDFNTGLLASTTDPNSQTTRYTYDNMWRLASVAYPDGGSGVVTRQETSFPNTATLTKKIQLSPLQNLIETNVFDGVGRVSQNQLTDPQGMIYTTTTYDGDGRKASVTNPYRTTSDPTYGTTSYVYDGLGRTCVVVPPDGTAVAGSVCPASQPSNDVFTTYAGNQTTVADQRGITRKSQTDGLGRVTYVWEAPSGVNFQTAYTYDALGDLISVVQGSSHNRSFVYDSLKRLTSSTNPETGTSPVTYAYDANGNVVTKTDARGTIINYSPTSNPIDQLNRVTSKTYSDGTPTVVYSYDGNAPSACSAGGFSYTNGIGRRTGMCDADGSEFWSYDPLGREKAEQRTTISIMKTTSYLYDLNGDLATLTYPSGRVITYTTDSAGRPSQAQDVPNNIFYTQGTCSNGINSLGVCYAPQGAVVSANIGPTGGSTWLNLAISYTDRLQPNRIQYYNQSGSLMLLQYSFVDASSHNNGNVMGITNLVDGTRSQQFTYDQLNRIATAETTSTYATSPAHCWGEAYVYDNAPNTTVGEFGNLTSISPATTAYSGCTQESLSVTANSQYNNNQITAFTYDASGNVLNDTHNSYLWNAESEIKSAAGVNYTYDGDGNRVQKSNGKIYWYGAGTEVLDESDSSGNFTDEYVFFGGKRVAHRVVSGNVIAYYGEDFLGSSRQIYTSASAVCYDADFYPFGGERIVTNTCAQNYKFEGKERDTETNNDDFGARYYSSSFGRWTSPDWSAIPAPVPYANLTNPQTLNLYAMVSDNPETFSDLDGHLGGIGGPVVEASYCASSSDGSCANDSPGNSEEQAYAQSLRSVVVQLNVIYDSEANGGKGLTDAQKKQFQAMLNESKGLYSQVGISFNVSYTSGARVQDMGGKDVDVGGAQAKALNVFVSNGLNLSENGVNGKGDGSSTRLQGNAVSFIGLGSASHWTLSHELAHQFLGDPKSNMSLKKMFSREPYINDIVIPHIRSFGDVLRQNAAEFASGP